MGTWDEVCEMAGGFGAQRLGATAWMFELEGRDPDRLQKVFVSYELNLMEPFFEFIQVKSAFVSIAEVDMDRVMRGMGQMQVGGLGYSPLFDAEGNPIDGLVTITTSIPLASLNVGDPTLLLYLHIVAKAADRIEAGISSPEAGDRY